MTKAKLRATYECGRCGNIQVRNYEAYDDGLLIIPNIYCGRCVSGRRPTTMTVTYSEVKAEDIGDDKKAFPEIPSKNTGKK